MSYTAIAARITVRPHPNADKLQLGNVLGNQVVVGLDTHDGDLGVYFPTDGQLSHEMTWRNNLYNESSAVKLAVHQDSFGFFDLNRRVRAQRFRGEKSDGLWLPISSLEWAGSTSALREGDQLTEFNGHSICNKYYNPRTLRAMRGGTTKTSRKDSIYFPKHIDTTQFRFVANTLPEDGVYYITEKLHGTSGRFGLVLDDLPAKWWQRVLTRLIDTPRGLYHWSYYNGSRNVTLEKTTGEGYYGTNEFRHQAVAGLQLRKGEILFYELVGWVNNTTPIMPPHDSSKLGDKAFTTKFGKSIPYTYGCPSGQCRLYLYKIGNVNEDGILTELSWPQLVLRAKELGLQTVPLLSGPLTADLLRRKWTTDDFHEALRWEVENWTASQESALSPLQVKEGVVLRVESPLLGITHIKNKSYEFKVMEGILKEADTSVDLEEIS